MPVVPVHYRTFCRILLHESDIPQPAQHPESAEGYVSRNGHGGRTGVRADAGLHRPFHRHHGFLQRRDADHPAEPHRPLGIFCRAGFRPHGRSAERHHSGEAGYSLLYCDAFHAGHLAEPRVCDLRRHAAVYGETGLDLRGLGKGQVLQLHSAAVHCRLPGAHHSERRQPVHWHRSHRSCDRCQRTRDLADRT